MKISDITSAVLKGVELASHANTLTDIVGAMIGKEPPLSDGDKPKHVGWGGLFGHNDELELTKMLAEIAKTDKEARDVFLRFLETKFPAGKTWPERVAHLRSANAFRSFVVNLGRSPSRDYKVDETITRNDKGEVSKTHITWGKEPGINHSLEFLTHCVATIRSGKTEAQGRTQLMRELRAMNIPTPSDNLAKTVESVTSSTSQSIQKIDARLQAYVDGLEQNRGPLRRFFDRII